MEAVSNTSIVILRVVGGDENVSFKFETVKYSPKGLRSEKDCAGEGQQTDPPFRQRGRPTKTGP
jgi:hypothetical protein